VSTDHHPPSINPDLGSVDFIVASVHSWFQLDKAAQTRRILRAASNRSQRYGDILPVGSSCADPGYGGPGTSRLITGLKGHGCIRAHCDPYLSKSETPQSAVDRKPRVRPTASRERNFAHADEG
jgi:hypothetical protein